MSRQGGLNIICLFNQYFVKLNIAHSAATAVFPPEFRGCCSAWPANTLPSALLKLYSKLCIHNSGRSVYTCAPGMTSPAGQARDRGAAPLVVQRPLVLRHKVVHHLLRASQMSSLSVYYFFVGFGVGRRSFNGSHLIFEKN